jgi:hypothetical protein
MKTILTTAVGLMLTEVSGRDDAIKYLLRNRKAGAFMLVAIDPGRRVDIQWLRVQPVNSLECSVSYASQVQGFNWQYLDHFPYPRSAGQIVRDTIAAAMAPLPEPKPEPSPVIVLGGQSVNL